MHHDEQTAANLPESRGKDDTGGRCVAVSRRMASTEGAGRGLAVLGLLSSHLHHFERPGHSALGSYLSWPMGWIA